MARKIRNKIKQALKAKRGLGVQPLEYTQAMDHYIPQQIMHIPAQETVPPEPDPFAEAEIEMPADLISDDEDNFINQVLEDDIAVETTSTLTPIAFLLQDQVEAFKSILDAVKKLEHNEYKDSVIDALLAKLERPDLKRLEQLTQTGQEEDSVATINILCDITHDLFLMRADSIAVIRLYAHLNDLEQSLYNSQRIQELILHYNALLDQETDQDLQLKIRHTLNTLQLNTYFDARFTLISNLMAINKHEYETEILDLIVSENPVMSNIINSASLPISVTDVEAIKLILQSLDENLSILAVTHLEMIYKPVDNNTLKRFKIIADLLSKQCHDLDILFVLDDALAKNIKQHGIASLYKTSHQMINTIHNVKRILNSKTNQHSKSISTFMLRLERGDFFHDNEFHLLKDAVYSFFNYVQPKTLIDILLTIFARLDKKQKVNALEFIQLFLSMDKKAQFFSSKYEHNLIVDRLNMFNHLVSSLNSDETVMDKLNALSTLIIDKIIFKDQWFSQRIMSIKSGAIPAQEMLFRLNTFNSQFPEEEQDIGALEERAIEVNAMLESPIPWRTGNEGYNRSFQSALDTFINHMSNISDLREYHKLLIQHRDQPSMHNHDESFIHDFREGNIELLSKLKQLTAHTLNVNEFNELLTLFYTEINNGFLNRFKDIDIREIVDKNWLKDDERIKNKLMIIASNIRRYQQYFNINSKFIALSIMYQVESISHIDHRIKIQHIQAMHDFYEQLEKYALEKKNVLVALCVHNALEMPYIKRLALSSDKNLSTSLMNQLRDKALQYSNYVEIAPPISDYLETFVDLYNRNYKSEIEFHVLTGRKLKEFEKVKQPLIQSKDKTDTTKIIYSVLYKLNLVHQPIFYQDILVNEKKIIDLLKEVSMDMKPTVYEKRTLADFATLTELKQHLLYCYNRNIDYLLEQNNPKKDIVSFIVEQSQDELSEFNDAISILDLIEKIEASQNRTYTEASQHLAMVLQPYQELIDQTIHSDNYSINEVENFFLAFNTHTKIKEARELPKEKKAFAGKNDLRSLVKLLDDYYNEFKRKILIQQEEKRQSTYSELLIKILEGDKQEGFIPFRSSGLEDHTHQNSLLPETEYPVPLAEPEHPDYIGINKTMNFNPAPLPNSVLSIFETKELIQDFIMSFAWGAKIEKLQVLENAKYNPSLNILGIDHLYSPLVQLKVMNLVLVSLDAIGKIAGQAGGYAIHNFTAIKEINDRLNEITQVITSEYADDEIIIARCARLTHAVYELNQECFALLKEDRPYPIENNVLMNEFCHINEHLVHRLTGIDYRETVLTPISTSSDYYKKLSQRARMEIPTTALYEERQKTVRKTHPPQNANTISKESREK